MGENMKGSLSNVTIDLTFSPARVLLKHRGFTEGEIINIESDESFELSNPTPCVKKIKNLSNEAQAARNQNIRDPNEEHKIGHCPICWDEFGKNPLSSTFCGHVFCTECLEQSLKRERRCPTCRRHIQSRSKYHPLYLPQ